MMRRALSHKLPAAILALAFAAACEVDFVPRAEAREEWKKSYPSGSELTIENTNGTIRVRPGSGQGIEIVATRIAKAGSDEAAKKMLAERRIEETVSGGAIKLSNGGMMSSFGGGQYQVDYEVRAPVAVLLTLRATNGTIDVSDWEGRLEMSATNGKLTGDSLKGEVDARATNGEINLRMAALHDKGLKVETTNGEITVSLPRDAKGRLLARVTNGGISVDGLNAEASPSNTRRRYEAVLNGGGPTVSIETTNGGINVRGM